jgi:transposase InsO family protein
MQAVPYGLGWSSSYVLGGGKWYVLVVDNYSRYAWVFFLADNEETFGFVRDLILRLKIERNGDVVQAIHRDNGSEFKNSHFKTFCHDLGLEHQFSSPMWLVRMAWLRGKNVPFERWLGRCLA